MDPDPEVGSVILRIRTPTTTEVKPKSYLAKLEQVVRKAKDRSAKKPNISIPVTKITPLIKSGGLSDKCLVCPQFAIKKRNVSFSHRTRHLCSSVKDKINAARY